jgi:anti-sigma regulatory factor (Ser/Thr protein kinase)
MYLPVRLAALRPPLAAVDGRVRQWAHQMDLRSGDRVMATLSGPTSLSEARRLTVRTLSGWGLAERASDAALVVSELAANGLRHGSGPVRLVLRCAESRQGSSVACTVRDNGTWSGARIPDCREIAEASGAESGRGLYIARELADSLTVRAARYRLGTAVTATFLLPAAARGRR